MSSCGMPQANSTTSRPRCTSPGGVGEHLAVLVGDDLGELARRARSPARGRRTGPSCACSARPGSRTRTPPSRPPRPRPRRRSRPSTTSCCCSPVAGLHTGGAPGADAAGGAAADPVLDGCQLQALLLQVWSRWPRLAALVGGRGRPGAVQRRRPRRPARPTSSRDEGTGDERVGLDVHDGELCRRRGPWLEALGAARRWCGTASRRRRGSRRSRPGRSAASPPS